MAWPYSDTADEQYWIEVKTLSRKIIGLCADAETVVPCDSWRGGR